MSTRSSIADWSQRLPARGATIASVGIVLLVFAVAGWSGMRGQGDSNAYDSAAFKDYAETIRQTGRLPTVAENYEYSLPPGYPLLGAYLDRAVAATSVDVGSPLQSLPAWLRRGIWLALSIFALLAITLARRRSRIQISGIVAAVIAGLWAAATVTSFVDEQRWAAKVLMTLALTGGVVLMAALLAREAWPDRVYAPALAALATALLPAVLRVGIVFHPDPLFALLSAGAVLLVLRARDAGWPLERGIAVGAALGCAALVRQSAPVVILSVAVIVLLIGRRPALRFGIVALVAMLVVAVPWWGYQSSRFGNPIESNLDRPGYMLAHEPVSFFVSFPFPSIVTHPYRESFRNELLPKFHAELWSDWFGAEHSWATSSRADRVLASSQSVLGFGGDALVLGGLIGFGFPALRRARRPGLERADATLAALTMLFVLGWAAYVLTLIRFPQADGDPIQAHYLLFLAPAAGIFAVSAARWAWRRSLLWRILLASWLLLYAISFTGVLITSFH